MSGSRADSPIRWAVGDSGGVVAGNGTRAFYTLLPIQPPEIPAQPASEKRLRGTYPGLSAIKFTIGIQPLPRHRELQAKFQTGNYSCDVVSHPNRCSSLGSVDLSNLEDVQGATTGRVFIYQAIFQLLTCLKVVLKTNAQTALPTQAVVPYGVPSPVPVAYHAGKSLKTLDPATTALLAGRYSPLWSGRLAGCDVETVKWLQIEAIPLLCSDGLACVVQQPSLHRSPHRCNAETVLAPSSLCV
ncbi:hypothetical protein QBC45DRAFT_482029 [Copromyces sp. CBS 386.78]|nr:hypothetical protein QBC45DRAFT_482029 [Copromyces sp. CBS 386.78]